jgi:uncharacterized protein YjiS (DUF1127 family)
MDMIIASLALTAPHGRRSAGHVPRNRFLRWLYRKKERAHLQALSDHHLRDIGLERGQIDDVLRGAVSRP